MVLLEVDGQGHEVEFETMLIFLEELQTKGTSIREGVRMVKKKTNRQTHLTSDISSHPSLPSAWYSVLPEETGSC